MALVRTLLFAAALAAALGADASRGAGAQTLRIGLAADPDTLDPTLYRTFDSFVVLGATCDTLLALGPDQQIVPGLAAEYRWSDGGRTLQLELRPDIRFHDGEPLDAASVKYTIERHLTLPGSMVRSLLSPIEGVEVLGERTVAIHLSSPFAPLLGLLASRVGMIMSPHAAERAPDSAGSRPVCAGPFRVVERVPQDRIVLERFPGYRESGRVHFERIVFRAYPDASVRLANLQSGNLDLIEQVAATDLAMLRGDKRFQTASTGIAGYAGITINLANGERSRNPLGRDPRVREAFELSLDRDIINRVVFSGEQQPNNQWIPLESPFHVKGPIPKRDVARAQALLREAGTPNPAIELMTVNAPERVHLAQVIQSLAKDAGFDVRLQATELTAALQAGAKGEFEAFQVNYIGAFPDPDATSYRQLSCAGSANDGRYCSREMDDALERARTTLDPAERGKAYAAAVAIAQRDRPVIYLYQLRWHWAYTARLAGFQPSPTGVIDPLGLALR
jgi:peptide/nickel transport system substrate-binding protein